MDIKDLCFVKVCNEDQVYYTLIKYLDSTQFKEMRGMRCKKSSASISITNKFKGPTLLFEPCEGTYELTYEGEPLIIKIDRGAVQLTTECRMIEYLKELTVYRHHQKIHELRFFTFKSLGKGGLHHHI